MRVMQRLYGRWRVIAVIFLAICLLTIAQIYTFALSDKTIRVACTAGTTKPHPSPEFALCKHNLERVLDDTSMSIEAIPVWGDANKIYRTYLRWLHNNSMDDDGRSIDLYQVDMVSVAGLADYFLTLYPCEAGYAPFDPYPPHRGLLDPLGWIMAQYDRLRGKSRAKYCPVSSDVVDKHFDTIIDYSLIEGRLKAIPWFVDIGLLYFRRDLVDRYHDVIVRTLNAESIPNGAKAVPATWEQLVNIARIVEHEESVKLPNAKLWGFVWQGHDYEGLLCNAVEWIHSLGERLIDGDGDQLKIGLKGTEPAIKMAKSWMKDTSPPEVKDFDEGQTTQFFKSGRSIFMRNWPHAWWELPLDKFGVLLLPRGKDPKNPHPATLGGQQLAVAKASQNSSEAVRLLLALTGEKIQGERAHKGFLPTLKSAYEPEQLEKNETLQAMDKSLQDNNEHGYGLRQILKSNTIVGRPSGTLKTGYNHLSVEMTHFIHGTLFTPEDDVGERLNDLDNAIQHIQHFITQLRLNAIESSVARSRGG